MFILLGKRMGMDTLEYVLNKFNLKDLGKMPVEIPNFGRDQLADLFKELGFVKGAEIGVKEGKYSEVLCKANPGLLLYSIDPWKVQAYFREGEKSIDGDGIPVQQETFNTYYERAKRRLVKYNCRIIADYSLEAVKGFPDGFLDFVYIDGNHEFQNCVNDICEWSRKVRSGGIVAGHDYTRYRSVAKIHVKWVVDAYTRCYDIKPWFVLGTEGEYPGMIRDESRSWMWIKA